METIIVLAIVAGLVYFAVKAFSKKEEQAEAPVAPYKVEVAAPVVEAAPAKKPRATKPKTTTAKKPAAKKATTAKKPRTPRKPKAV